MPSGYRKIFGQEGEERAIEYLQNNGYRIVERNFRTRNGEIDIIAIDESLSPKELVFVEVKTRFSDSFGDPLEAITYYKMKALRRTALFYQVRHPKLPQILRLDAVAVILNKEKNNATIRLVKNIG